MPPTILICEDEPSLRELVRATLGSGYDYVDASDGDEAARLIHAHRPSLIVLDRMLPRVSGVGSAVLGDLRARRACQYSRGRTRRGAMPREAALAAGANRFLASR